MVSMFFSIWQQLSSSYLLNWESQNHLCVSPAVQDKLCSVPLHGPLDFWTLSKLSCNLGAVYRTLHPIYHKLTIYFGGRHNVICNECTGRCNNITSSEESSIRNSNKNAIHVHCNAHILKSSYSLLRDHTCMHMHTSHKFHKFHTLWGMCSRAV